MNPKEKMRGMASVSVAGLLLVLMGVLAGGAALRESVTVDEVSHIGAGVSYLQRLDLRMNEEHPPLAKVLAAIPLILRGVHADYTHISWTFSEKFFPAFLGQWVFGEWLLEKWNEPKAVLMWSRLPMLLLTLALGWVVYAFGRRLGGEWAGLLCLGVYVSTPAFLAFGPLVHTDIAVTLFSLLALWTFGEVWKEPSRKNVLLFGLSLAAALLSKFTAGVLFFAFVASVLSLRWRGVPGQPRDTEELRMSRRARWRGTFKGVLLAALTVYLFYFVLSWHQPTDALYKLGAGPVALVVRRLLLAPLLYVRGVFWVLLTSKRPTFVLGHAYAHGVWFYFPAVFALKSSLGFLGLLILLCVVAVSRKARGAAGASAIPEEFAVHWRILWVSLLVFTGTCLLSPLDISIRHFSVPMALLILMLAPLPRILGELREWTQTGAVVASTATVALVASCLFTAVHTYPYFFPYVNSLSLGRPAYALLNDSNVDWNQALPEVKRFAEEHGLEKIGLDRYGFSDPTAFVPQAQIWNCQSPAREDAGKWVALSANFIIDGHNCEWLMQYPHAALGGGSMYAVHLPVAIPAAGSEGGPPLPSAFRQFGGAPFDLRVPFTHIIEHPEDLPLLAHWMQTAFSGPSKGQGPPPKYPWEK
jgi:Dolichyl-phosphate-mannose-protein mannosyltransferase